ncbi:hypothetical protein [Candidatus Laterigemmans baculatus]|uniref:hypothetical protein n=1 Tax=Candidatus Laterigemmans baculatus TaxID=2770505 RepID=UPI0013D9DF42|nr:hypothetical protein [Candidatus Laterigemmans baculatus]
MSVRRVAVFVGVALFAGGILPAFFASPGHAQFDTPTGLQAVPTSSGAGGAAAVSTSQDPPSLQAGNASRPSGAAAASGSPSPQPQSLSSQSLPSQRARPQAGGVQSSGGGGGELPSGAGQIYDTLDLRPYTGYLTKHDRPHQAIVDWILRDTGTDMWFTEPFGFLNANRDSLTVYHTPEIHSVVRGVVDKFVAGSKDPQTIGLRVMTVGSPNWRARAVPLMEHVNVGSPGVQAWLVTKENTAVLLSLLRQRSDAKEVQAIDIALYNGQSENLTSTRRRNYVRNIRSAPTGWPPYEPELGEVEEGYKLEISPLLNTDGTTLDCVIQAEIDQVEQLVPVELDLPLPNGQMHRTRIEVPQVISWRLHERFRWPMDRVLVLSCGVVASPDRAQAAVPFLNLEPLTGQTAGRADALLFVEFKGPAAANLPLGPRTASPNVGFSRGRY